MSNVVDFRAYARKKRGTPDYLALRERERAARREIMSYRDTLKMFSQALPCLRLDQAELDQAPNSMRCGGLTEADILAAADRIIARLFPG